MSQTYQSPKVTGGERLTALVLRWAPLLGFLLFALPAPLYFLLRYFTATEEVGVYMLLALVSLAAGTAVGLIVALILFLFRRHWEKKMRERLAADGITTAELDWFRREMTGAERRALKQVEAQNALLADAYRETLAARLTATYVAKNSEREMIRIERRINQAVTLQGSARDAFREDLRADRLRAESALREARSHRAEAETRLQMIEAAASRGAGADETRIALERLGLTTSQTPYALEAARLEHEARRELEAERRGGGGSARQ